MISESTTNSIQRFKFTLLWDATTLNQKSVLLNDEKRSKQGETLAWNGLLKRVQEINTHLTFTCSKSTVEMPEKGVKYVQS